MPEGFKAEGHLQRSTVGRGKLFTEKKQEKKEEKIEEVRQRFQKAGADAVILHMGELLKLL